MVCKSIDFWLLYHKLMIIFYAFFARRQKEGEEFVGKLGNLTLSTKSGERPQK